MHKRYTTYLKIVATFIAIAATLAYLIYNFSYTPSEVAKSINYNLDIINKNSQETKVLFKEFEMEVLEENKSGTNLADLLGILQDTKDKLLLLEEKTKNAKSKLVDGYNQDTKALTKSAREITYSRSLLIRSLIDQITAQSCTLQRADEFTANFSLAEKNLNQASSKTTPPEIIQDLQIAIDKINIGVLSLSQIKLCYTSRFTANWTQDMQLDLDSDITNYNTLAVSLSQLILGLEKSDTKVIDQATSQIAALTTYKTKLFENQSFKNFIQGLETEIVKSAAAVESQENSFADKHRELAKKYRLEIK